MERQRRPAMRRSSQAFLRKAIEPGNFCYQQAIQPFDEAMRDMKRYVLLLEKKKSKAQEREAKSETATSIFVPSTDVPPTSDQQSPLASSEVEFSIDFGEEWAARKEYSVVDDTNSLFNLSFLFESCVEARDRRYRMKTYKNCFVGRKTVDKLVATGAVKTRVEAVELGRKLERELNLFQHVSGEHAFCDEYFFYRMSNNNQAADSASMLSSFLRGSEQSACGISSMASSVSETPTRLKSQADEFKRIVAPLIRNRKYRLKLYKSVFVGEEAVDALINQDFARSRSEAVSLCLELETECSLFQHVTGEHQFCDGFLFYRLNTDLHDSLPTDLNFQDVSLSRTNSNFLLKVDDFKAIVAALVDDRYYGERCYRNVFFGEEVVDSLVQEGVVSNRQEAVLLGKRVAEETSLFSPVTGSYDFCDDCLLFRFTVKAAASLRNLLSDVPQWHQNRSVIFSHNESMDDASSVSFNEEFQNMSLIEYLQTLETEDDELPCLDPEILQECWYGDYHGIIKDNESEGMSPVMLRLAAATHLVQEMYCVSQTIATHMCRPKGFSEDVFNHLLEFLHPRIVRLFCARMEQVSPDEAIHLICWIDQFVATSKEFGSTTAPIWREDVLFDMYVEHIHTVMDTLIERLANDYTCDDHIRMNAEGHLVMDLPSQLGFLLDQQKQVLVQNLPSQYHERVFDALQAELARLVGKIREVIKAPDFEVNAATSQYCALINDASAVAESLENVFVAQDSDALAAFWVQFSLDLLQLLVNRMMKTLHCKADDVMGCTGMSNGWDEVAFRTVATLSDYLRDIETWLSDSSFYLPRILRLIIYRCLEDYLVAFVANTMEDGLDNPCLAAAQIRKDRETFVDFFTEGHPANICLGRPGYQSVEQVDELFGALSCIANLVDPAVSPEMAYNDIRVIKKLDAPGSPMILHLVGLRKRHEDDESAQWLRIIGKVGRRKSVMERPLTDRQLPDASESKYAQNISAGYFVNRRLSATTAAAIVSTRNLLRSQATGFNVLRQWDTTRGADINGNGMDRNLLLVEEE